MKEKIVLAAKNYNKVDGRNAYTSKLKKLTLGKPYLKENKKMQIAAQIWKENDNKKLEISSEIPIHQIMDLMIFLGSTLLYFKEAYRHPLLYDPENPVVDRVGLQGDALSIEIFTENQNIDQEIKPFSQSLNDLGEITGERIRVLRRILKELELY